MFRHHTHPRVQMPVITRPELLKQSIEKVTGPVLEIFIDYLLRMEQENDIYFDGAWTMKQMGYLFLAFVCTNNSNYDMSMIKFLQNLILNFFATLILTTGNQPKVMLLLWITDNMFII